MQDADRNEQLQRIVEVAAEPIAAAAALGHQPQRQPHQRAERRLDGAEEHGGAAEQEQRERGHRAWALARSGPRADRPAAQPALERGPSGRRRARDRSRAGAAGRAAPAPAARSASECPAARAWRRATPAAITMSPRYAGLVRRKREDVGRARPCRGTARLSARTRASGTRATVTAPRARAGATPASQRAEPGRAHAARVTTSTARRDGRAASADRSAGGESPSAIRRGPFECGVVRLDDLLHQLVAHDVLVVEVDEADALDVLDDLQRLDQARTRADSAGRSA